MILLARHGETDDNAPPQRVQGSIDTPLNERGREQARALAGEVRSAALRAIVTSHLARARETAEIVGATLGIEPSVDPRLAESHRGWWEGRLLEDIEREEPEAWAAWRAGGAGFRFPGGESLGEHQARVLAALADLAAGPTPVLAVTHGGSIRVALAASRPRGLDEFFTIPVPNASLFRYAA
ncbi:MAG: histidine phosphatase family protein [Solirubrobacteraceae bacterium]